MHFYTSKMMDLYSSCQPKPTTDLVTGRQLLNNRGSVRISHWWVQNFIRLNVIEDANYQKIWNRDWSKKKPYKIKNCLLIKNEQFLRYHHETWSKGPPHWFVILTKFHDDSSKIVDFFVNSQVLILSGYFWIRLYLQKIIKWNSICH